MYISKNDFLHIMNRASGDVLAAREGLDKDPTFTIALAQALVADIEHIAQIAAELKKQIAETQSHIAKRAATI